MKLKIQGIQLEGQGRWRLLHHTAPGVPLALWPVTLHSEIALALYPTLKRARPLSRTQVTPHGRHSLGRNVYLKIIQWVKRNHGLGHERDSWPGGQQCSVQTSTTDSDLRKGTFQNLTPVLPTVPWPDPWYPKRKSVHKSFTEKLFTSRKKWAQIFYLQYVRKPSVSCLKLTSLL